MHRLSRLVGLNASCFLVVLALGASAGCNDRKRSGGDNDAGDAGNAGASESGAGGHSASGSGGMAPSGGTESGGTESGGTESGGTSGSAGAGGETETAGSGGTSGESGTAGTGGTSGGGGTAGTSGEAGSAGVAGGGQPGLGRSTARLVPGGTIMRSERFRFIGTMSNGIAEGTSSASANYEAHGLVAGAH
jgi:hypothetical protein